MRLLLLSPWPPSLVAEECSGILLSLICLELTEGWLLWWSKRLLVFGIAQRSFLEEKSAHYICMYWFCCLDMGFFLRLELKTHDWSELCLWTFFLFLLFDLSKGLSFISTILFCEYFSILMHFVLIFFFNIWRSVLMINFIRLEKFVCNLDVWESFR